MTRTDTDSPTFAQWALAIHTRYIGPTDTRPARIAAVEPIRRRRIVVSYDSVYDPRRMHEVAARRLCYLLDVEDAANGYRERDWERALVGESADGRGYVFLAPPVAETVPTVRIVNPDAVPAQDVARG